MPPSCQAAGPGTSNCGPGGMGTESCCTSLGVAGGTYYRTYTNDGAGPTGEADPATVSSFRLDKYLVTVGRFRQFVNAVLPPNGATGWLPSDGSGKHVHLNRGQGLVNSASPGAYEPGWTPLDNSNIAPTNANLSCAVPSVGYATWTPLVGSQENLPINCVNWWESYAFCIWDGGFLPTEAEWGYAGGAGNEQREYPWGSTAAGPQYATYGCDYPNESATCTGVANIAPVGYPALGAGRWEQLDLAGEVWEWNLDWHADYISPCIDCSYLTSPPDTYPVAPPARAFRGGIFLNYASSLLPANRYYHPPTDRDGSLGFRCARTP